MAESAGRALLVGAAALLAMAGAADAAGTKTVKDWTAVCDNVGTCTAFGFSPETDDTDAYLVVRRAAGGAAAPSVTVVFDPGDKELAADWRLTLDGKPIAGVGLAHAAGSDGGARARISPAAAAALIEALRGGQTLELVEAGKPLAGVSLAGSAAVLLWVDDQQGRVGTVTALTRKGPKPASAVPPPAAPPLIAAAAPVSQAGLPKYAPKSLIKPLEDCDSSVSMDKPDDIVARLAPGVVLWGPECQMAAYNETSVFFVGDEHAGHLRRVSFPEPPGSEQASDDVLMNVGFETRTQTLTSFSKGRGLADCGASEQWVWTGKAFALLHEDIMPECRGVSPDDWPALFVGKRR